MEERKKDSQGHFEIVGQGFFEVESIPNNVDATELMKKLGEQYSRIPELELDRVITGDE